MRTGGKKGFDQICAVLLFSVPKRGKMERLDCRVASNGNEGTLTPVFTNPGASRVRTLIKGLQEILLAVGSEGREGKHHSTSTALTIPWPIRVPRHCLQLPSASPWDPATVLSTTTCSTRRGQPGTSTRFSCVSVPRPPTSSLRPRVRLERSIYSAEVGSG